MSDRFIKELNPLFSFHVIAFIEAVSLSASLPTVSPHVSPSITHCLSFPLRPFHFTVCPLCNLGMCGRLREGLQAAVEIGSWPGRGQADHPIRPRKDRQKSLNERGPCSFFCKYLFYVRALNTLSWHQTTITNDDCLIKHFLHVVCVLKSTHRAEDRAQLRASRLSLWCKLEWVEITH